MRGDALVAGRGGQRGRAGHGRRCDSAASGSAYGVCGADCLELEVVGCTVGEAAYGLGAVIAGIGPGVEGAAGLTIAVLVAREMVRPARLEGADHVSVTCWSPRAALTLVGAEMLGDERTVALTCADQALMTPAELTARPW